MLLQIRNYINKHGQVSAQQICRHFDIDFSALEPMLLRWQAKGIIEASTAPSACGKACIKCAPAPLIYYTAKH